MGFDIDSTVPIFKEKNVSTQNITDARSPLPSRVQCKELRNILFSLELQNQALHLAIRNEMKRNATNVKILLK